MSARTSSATVPARRDPVVIHSTSQQAATPPAMAQRRRLRLRIGVRGICERGIGARGGRRTASMLSVIGHLLRESRSRGGGPSSVSPPC